jgi:hypothetical protein
MKSEKDSIDDGRTIASDLERLGVGPRWELEQYRAAMTDEDRSDLATYRQQQMASMLDGVENSAEGEAIRTRVASQVYAERFEANLRAQLKGQSKA